MRRSPLRSPPRMRGKVPGRTAGGCPGGITPAYAGKSYYGIWDNVAKWDHPRVCGEKTGPESRGRVEEGSPPRMRGKGADVDRHGLQVWITPAYAGKSLANAQSKVLLVDHPRVCGEKSIRVSSPVPQLGSPPRMRGKVFTLCFLWAKAGSPPRMRGKAGGKDPESSLVGITPAYAGKSSVISSAKPTPRDHPRVCGEKFGNTALFVSKWGSPPRMRGKVDTRPLCSRSMGITPAYAGKRNCGIVKRSLALDHPRVCGEKTKKIP